VRAAARASACSIVSVVSRPSVTGTSYSADASATPRAAWWATTSKCGVSPRTTAPTATTAA
jgi:hypothetical protein